MDRIAVSPDFVCLCSFIRRRFKYIASPVTAIKNAPPAPADTPIKRDMLDAPVAALGSGPVGEVVVLRDMLDVPVAALRLGPVEVVVVI